MLGKWLGAGLVIAGAATAAYFRFVRQWHLHWGATAEEAGGAVAGDELMPDPDIVATRAVEIDAPPSAIWPWLVQMGPGRGGAYTYDWIERRLGIGPRSTSRHGSAVGARRQTLWPDFMTVSKLPAPRLTVPEAAERLEAMGQPFMCWPTCSR